MTTNIAPHPLDIAAQERWERLRSHKRFISRVKLLVEWEHGGAKERANAVTVDVSHSGCMAVVGADLPLRKLVVAMPLTALGTQLSKAYFQEREQDLAASPPVAPLRGV